MAIGKLGIIGAGTVGSELLVLAAGRKQRPGESRLDLAAANVALCRSALPPALAAAPDALVLVVTNPVDVVTFAAGEVAGLAAGQVFGSGTVLDTARLRVALAAELLDQVRGAAGRIIRGKGATSTAIGFASARIIDAVGLDERAVLSVSTAHEAGGIGPVCYSLPTVVGRHGAGPVVATAETGTTMESHP